MPCLGYLDALLWDQVTSRCRLFLGLEGDRAIRSFLVGEGGLSPSTAEGVIAGHHVTLTPQEVARLSDLLAFPEALFQAVISRRPGGELLGLLKGLDAEGYDRQLAEGTPWDGTPREGEAVTGLLCVSWALASLDGGSADEDILALAHQALRWTVVGAAGGGRR